MKTIKELYDEWQSAAANRLKSGEAGWVERIQEGVDARQRFMARALASDHPIFGPIAEKMRQDDIEMDERMEGRQRLHDLGLGPDLDDDDDEESGANQTVFLEGRT